ncbi:MAG: THUMP domain-containing protein [Candidatus Heimdallarchaeota archaeon]|nr:THUMP domain-containing protein [Candidatus Heimdallarchaeota archaeon]MBY8994124.1 THUMP domain-containing protein [Candidatus Heimdallarchaeota archaeon]
MEISKAIERKAKFILVSCEAVKERDGMSELWHVLVKYCKVTPLEAFSLPVKGLFLIAIEDDLTKTFEKIREVIAEKKFPFIICKKITPMEQLIKSDFNGLTEIIAIHLQKIPSNVKWRITLRRRHTKLKRTDVINLIASHPLAPKGKVDLSNPDWDIVVEIFGEWLGVGAFKHDPIIVIK